MARITGLVVGILTYFTIHFYVPPATILSEGPAGPPAEFEEWAEWTECSRTCGGGRQARERKCLVTEDGDYIDCTGSLRDIQDCQTNPCPGIVSYSLINTTLYSKSFETITPFFITTVDCEWEWGEYDECSTECGGGTRTRYPVIIERPQYGGRPCPANVRNNQPDSISCNIQACPGGYDISILEDCNHF